MTYLTKIDSPKGIIKYEYSGDDKIPIGTIEMSIDVPIDTSFEKRNLQLEFYEGKKFDYNSSGALQSIARFIKLNVFPETYTRATH